MTQKEYKNLFDEDDAVGWLEIDKVVEGIYGDQKPRHYAPPLHYMVGGEDPLDGVSIYDSQKDMFHRHLVSYGMSELYYNEEAAGGEFSKWGFEFTFRLKPFAEDGDDRRPSFDQEPNLRIVGGISIGPTGGTKGRNFGPF